nr:hypothetical protein [uncultured Campylobacter sp.]
MYQTITSNLTQKQFVGAIKFDKFKLGIGWVKFAKSPKYGAFLTHS